MWSQFLVILLLCLPSFSNASSIRASDRSSKPKPSKPPAKTYPHNAPDPFLSSSPLIVAAVASDGIALLSLHVAHTAEPLLFNQYGKQDEKEHELADLPLDTKGPLRIHKVDNVGSALMMCGWKTDGMVLVDHAREASRKECERYGDHTQQSGEYGRFLAKTLSFRMAAFAAGESLRSLRCAGLLATAVASSSSSRDERWRKKGELWLVDATGIYSCRAYALGAGSKVINRKLLDLDFSQLSVRECAHLLLQTVRESLLVTDTGDEEDAYRIPTGSRVEMGVVEFESQQMKRLRQPFWSES